MIEGRTKRKQKTRCMPLCHSPKSFVLKMVFIRKRRRNKQTSLKRTKEEETI
jgi:hypothetical protein